MTIINCKMLGVELKCEMLIKTSYNGFISLNGLIKMKKPKTLEVFEKGYEKGLKGQVESFDIWLKSIGMTPSKFNFVAISKFLMHDPLVSVNLEKEVETIGQFLGFYTKEKEGLYHIPVIGVLGSGKTHLLSLIGTFLQKMKPPVKHFLVDASTFSNVDEKGEEQQIFYQILDTLKAEQFDVLLIDSCETDKNIVNALKSIISAMKKGVLITCWTPEHWSYLKDSMADFLSVSKEIHLNLFDDGDTTKLVSNVLEYVSGGQPKLSKETIEKIYSLSFGIPSTTILLLMKAFNEAFLSHKKSVDVKSVEAAAKALGFENIFDRLNKLPEHQIIILKHVLLEYDERGIRPSTLVELLEKDKATISYHLSILNRSKLITQEKIGRSSFCRIKEEIKPYVQLRLAQEGEYHA